ncbi:hypothetical leucine rich repeat protein [Ectocarpus siliculosus]|uniref:Hypothetical leucine rich repeat protein n=1 Tax=Ectocarpus siliculosus TaxID=2880 RepID=D7G5Y6_ECTSI|nr:hypothetical leucine rich repeat protein [Ectocarpus siliculosus]|eukprot:CBJ33906.1 hypothetical leucine rich repeat protein [Ectocarpus siliculosus]
MLSRPRESQETGYCWNSLGDVPAGAFNGLAALQTLSLGGAGVTTLEAGTFSGLQALVELHLGQVVVIGGGLSGLAARW